MKHAVFRPYTLLLLLFVITITIGTLGPQPDISSVIAYAPGHSDAVQSSSTPIEPEPLDPGCPTDNTYINVDTVLSGEYCEVEDPDDNGVLIINVDNITLDCNGTTLDGVYSFGKGIVIDSKDNVTIKNCNIKRYDFGIRLDFSYKNNLINNNITDHGLIGILVVSSHDTNIEKNVFTKNTWGISIQPFSNNSIIINNGFCNNNVGKAISILNKTSSNLVYKNNFFDNGLTSQAEDLSEFNQWDDGSEGNYWNDYNGTDSNGDGIGDVPYTIDSDSQDNFPLMQPNLNAPICGPLQNDTEPEIIYSSALSDWDIWGMQADGSNKVQIASEAAIHEAFPVWSPDNSKIAFVSDKNGLGLWIMNSDGTNQIQVTQNITGLYGDWSPDGNRLVFASRGDPCSIIFNYGYPSDCNIYTVNIDGTNLTNLTSDIFPDFDPRWSPNGEEILFVSNRTGGFELWLMNSDGSNLRQLTSNIKFKGAPAWSQDGSKIAFVELTDNITKGLYIMNSDSTNKKLITAFNDSVPIYPSFSPDGQRITYTKYHLSGFSYIHVINIDGTGDMRLTNSTFDAISDWRNEPTGNETNDTTPPLPPEIFKAILTGINHQDIEISWYRSIDEGLPGGTVRYILARGGGNFLPPVWEIIEEKVADGSATYTFRDMGVGDGDRGNYFYYVRAYDEANNTAKSWYAGKFVNSLTAGEKFISIPLVQWNTSLEEVLKTLDFDKVWYFNVSDLNDHWKTYMTFKPYKGDLKNIDHKIGFWVNVTNDDNLIIAGLVPRYTEILLYKGWNMVGYPSFINRTVSEALAEVPWISVEAYDNNPPHYLKELLPSDVMSPGNGYWIEVSNDSIWNVINS